MKEFVKMPTGWITSPESGVLQKFRWKGEDKSDYIAALILYIVICHHVNDVSTAEFPTLGCAQISYSKFLEATGLSRPKISGGLKKLEEFNLVNIDRKGKTSIYKIVNYDRNQKWAKLPLKYLCNSDNEYKNIRVFREFSLRSKVELNAIKIYLLLIAFRNRETNLAIISYESISRYTSVDENEIKRALSFLVIHDLITVDKAHHIAVSIKTNNLYGIKGIRSNRHIGNISREDLNNSIEIF